MIKSLCTWLITGLTMLFVPFFVMAGVEQTVQSESAAATIIRTMVYRQITDFTTSTNPPILKTKISADGSKIIFSQGYPTIIYTVNADGTNLIKIFEYSVNTEPFIDISPDGSRILWGLYWEPDGVTIQFAHSDGSNRITITPTFSFPDGVKFGLAIPQTAPIHPRLAVDKFKNYYVYFISLGGNPDLAGCYRINGDGSGQTQLFSYRQMAKQLFNMSGDEMNGYWAFVDYFDISSDGARMVFGTTNFGGIGHTITYDGILHKVCDFDGRANYGVRISPDGNKIVTGHSMVFDPDPRTPIYSMNFDGSNQVVVTPNSKSSSNNFSELTWDGSQVLSLGEGIPLRMYNTDGSGSFRIFVLEFYISFPHPFSRAALGGGKYSLSADGSRFCFTTEPYGPNQLWVADINPSDPAGAPVIADVSFTPNWILANGASSATIGAQIIGGQGGISAAGISPLRSGENVNRYFNYVLYNDGTHGDAVAGDDRFTNQEVRNDLTPPDAVNPLAIRVTAISGNQRQVTAADAVPFYVLTQAPSGSAPHLDSISPSGGAPKTEVTLMGSGFDAIADNNVVLFGNRQAYIKSADASRTQLVVYVPADIASGEVPVTVTVLAQTSNAVSFNVLTSVEQVLSKVSQFELLQNYPNPFNAFTTFAFSLSVVGRVSLEIFDLQGRRVARVVHAELSPGHHRVQWNGASMASGVYLYRLDAGNAVQTRKLLLLK